MFKAKNTGGKEKNTKQKKKGPGPHGTTLSGGDGHKTGKQYHFRE